ncbi:MAG: tetratricopeptide repeat protein, partial [Bacteroidota bacterium]|nr:tetratricopeptide repeat protein [Bacteroidota bacterium]
EDSLSAPDDDGGALSLLHSRLGIVQFSGTLHEAALVSFQRATTYPAAQASAWSNLGFAHFRMARFQQSIAPFTRALMMDSTDVNALYCLGRMRMARPETAISGRWLLGRFLLLEQGTRRSGEIDRWLSAPERSM